MPLKFELPSSASLTCWCPSTGFLASSSETRQAPLGFGSPESPQAGEVGTPRCSRQQDHWQCTPDRSMDRISRPTAIAAGGGVGRQEKTSLPVTWQAPEITFLAFSWKLKCRRRGSGRHPSTLCFTGSGVGSCHGSAGGQPGAGVRGGGCSCRDAAGGDRRAGWAEKQRRVPGRSGA